MIHLSDKNVVICDREIRYANGLGENISEREDLAVKVYVCSSFEHVLELEQAKKIHIFIVDEEITYAQRTQIGANQVFVLARGKVADLGEEEWAIGKYQCADEIIRQVFEFYVDRTKENVMRCMNKERARLVAVYSPIHRVGKTTFALALGRECAKSKKVLYLNLEEYAGMEVSQDTNMNLGDLLYYLRQGNGNLGIRLQAAVKEDEGLDVVPPIPVVLDLKEVTWEEWEALITQLLENSLYEMVVLDVGESVQGLFPLLELCDRVYMPVLEDENSRRKLKQYQDNVEQLKLEKLKRITYQFVMPQNPEGFARILMKEEC
jgi:cellulose biosynthesis protein BcsQ